MPAVWARASAELRSGWRRSVGLVLLIGLVGGAAVAAAAGARRTDSALGRFNRTQRAADVLYLDDGQEAYHAGDAIGQISKFPVVAAVARAQYTYVLGNDGLLAAADGTLGRVVNRPKVLRGRLPHADRADEVAVTSDSLKRNNLHLGGTFPLVDVSVYPQAAQLVQEHPEVQLHLRVVGIVAVPGALPPFQPGSVAVYGTPALHRLLLANEGIEAIAAHRAPRPTPDSLIIRLRRGDADVPAFRRALQALAGDAPIEFRSPDLLDGNARRSMHLQAQALWLLAALLAFSAVLVFGQTLSRFIAIEGAEGPDLRALGMTANQLGAIAMVRMTLLAVAAAAIAVAVAVAASPLTPLGLARKIETAPGLSFDAAALALGAAAVVGFVVLLSLYPAWRTAKMRGAAEPGQERPSFIAGGVARAGLPPAVVAGTRMALEPGRGRTAVPVRSTIVGATVGVAALAAALTFGTSLAHLLDTPRLYGVAWDTRMTNYGDAGEGRDPDLAKWTSVVAHQPGVAAVDAATIGQTELAGRNTGIIAVRGRLRPPILAGRYPTGAEDIALGAKTMRRVHAHLGSTIKVNGPSGRRFAFRVVGKTVLPADSDPRLGEGIVVSTAALERVAEGSGESSAADSLLIRFAPGANRSAVVDNLQRVVGTTGSSGGVLDVLPPQKPTDLVNFGGVESLPFVLAGILAVVAVATLAHLLVSAVRRRRRDLAILKTIGFVRRQVAAAVAWQATTLVAIALLVGLPVGSAIGRWLWALFATQQGVVAEPRVPLPAILLLIPAAVVLANIVAALPARVAGMTRPALVLRTE